MLVVLVVLPEQVGVRVARLVRVGVRVVRLVRVGVRVVQLVRVGVRVAQLVQVGVQVLAVWEGVLPLLQWLVLWLLVSWCH